MTTNQRAMKITSDVVSQMTWTGLSAIVQIVVGAIFWRFGADFTIVALKWFASAFTTPKDSALWFALPFMFSAIECAAWKLGDKLERRARVLATGMTGLDMFSTVFGIGIAIITSYFVMLGILAPVWWMYLIAAVLALLGGWVVTLYPERLILDGCIQLFQIGKAIYLIVKR